TATAWSSSSTTSPPPRKGRPGCTPPRSTGTRSAWSTIRTSSCGSSARACPWPSWSCATERPGTRRRGGQRHAGDGLRALRGPRGGGPVGVVIFVVPGMGTALVQAVSQRDYPTVQALIFLMALVFLIVNLAVDLLYAWLDPRIHYA